MVRHGRGDGGFSLLEVVISAAILSMIALTLMAATTPLSRTASESAIGYDMDTAAGRFMSQLRREVRQSGYSWNPTRAHIRVSTLTPQTVEFRMRQAAGDDFNTAAAGMGGLLPWRPIPPANPANDGTANFITYTTRLDGVFPASGGTPRFQIIRTQDAFTQVVAENVRALNFQLPPNGALVGPSLSVNLLMGRTNPNWTAQGTAPPLVMRSYDEQIQFLNLPP
jgi:prepilin-type N-terminal cleavage/methylation domain-containing protein